MTANPYPLVQPFLPLLAPFLPLVRPFLAAFCGRPPPEIPSLPPLTPEQRERIAELVDASSFVSLLEAAYTVGIWIWKTFDPASAEVAEAVVLLVRACKILL